MFREKLKTIIFDMDGLLINTEKIYAEGWLEGFRELKLSLPEDIVYQMVGGSPENNNSLLNQYIQDMDTVLEVRKIRLKYFSNKLRNREIELMPYAKDLLIELNKRNYETILATSTQTQRASELIDHFKLNDYFAHFVFGDQVKEKKPAPDIYLRALELANKAAEEVIVLEDSVTGAKAAENANLNVILVADSHFTNTDNIKNHKIVEIHKDLNETFKFLLL